MLFQPTVLRGARLKLLASLMVALATSPSITRSQRVSRPDTTVTPGTARRLPGVEVIESVKALERIPGSAVRIDARQLRESRAFTTNELLRKVTGLNVREEEGLGLRPNIGVRGLSPTRSTKVLLLEDGVPFTIAPYGDNATYYHPPVDRFESVEVLKGSGQILYGPQTIGGVINYLTPAIPLLPEARVTLAGGSRGFRSAHARAGGTFGGAGIFGDYIRKEGRGARVNTASTLDDMSLKFLVPLAAQQSLSVRANLFRERSQVTYSGLTEAEYAADPRSNPFAADEMLLDRIGAALTHRVAVGVNAGVGAGAAPALTTTLYGYRVTRDWWRQSSNSAQRPNDLSDPQCGGMANLSTSCGTEGRLREYNVVGIEPRFAWQAVGAHAVLQVELGGRAHLETQERRQVNAAFPRSRTEGPPSDVNSGLMEDNRRTTSALAAYLQARALAGKFSVTPGIRVEHLRLTRLNRRPVPASAQGASGATSLTALIPGFGATYAPQNGVTVFAGVHRGFAPPRPEDVISNTSGGVVELSAEASWNTELGARWTPNAIFSLESTLFQLDFENQTVPASVAGGTGATLTSAGRTMHRGVELAIQGSSPVSAARVTPFVEVAATWLPIARFAGERFAYVGTAGSDVAGKVYADQNAPGTRTKLRVTGNRLPYAPEAMLTATIGARHSAGVDVRLEAVTVSGQFADPLNTRVLVPDGQQGPIAGNTLWNLTVNAPVFSTGVRAWLTVKNLTDHTVVVDRSRGLLPGMPRVVQMGFERGW
jgi:Fe(3+) dicitrate transport protein